jgi:hypothetical protein
MKRNWIIWSAGLLLLGSGLYWAGHRHVPVSPGQPPAAPETGVGANVPSNSSRTPLELEKKAFSPEVAAILGQQSTFQGPRIRAVRSLTRRLPLEEQEALLACLRDPTLPPGSTAVAERVVRNDLMNVLAAQGELSSGFFATLREIYANPRQDIVLRDYAIQHLVSSASRQTNINSQEAELNRQTLWDAVGERGSSIAGTALLALQRMASHDPTIDPNQLAAQARAVVEDPAASELARVSAIQVCAAQNLTAALPTLRNLAAQEHGSVPVRISAVGALGQLGSDGELAFLQSIQPTAARHLQPAIRSACTALARGRSGDGLRNAKR